MGSKQYLKSAFFFNPLTPSSHRQVSNTCKLPFSAFPSKPTSKTRPFCLTLVQTDGYSNVSEATEHRTEERNAAWFGILKHRLEELGFGCNISMPGQFNHLLCPMCKGGDRQERSLSLFIEQDGSYALWKCFRGKCGWRGSTRAFDATRLSTGTIFERQHFERSNKVTTVKRIREITVEDLQLKPPCDEIIAYFAARMISKETVQRNTIMQKCCGDQIVIAFTYWRNGKLINCKYRDVNKRSHFFLLRHHPFQEADTEKIFYGLDDIKEANEIIIVEGEMDKLAMEEAGFRNCVSVPNGAPSCVSQKDLPSEEMDTKYRYLWNCKEYLKKASRIILATDGDPPGQALAEELARRVGRERCWQVNWPKKNEVDHFKDANEVLMHMGPAALREVITHSCERVQKDIDMDLYKSP
ncbi:hypothetical protein TIFTF001_033936 [Ficus carica]|uniref:Toprim domain-containing protein n=1 Tax=Ficus carica TaxID=3494 RepID=A0AA88JA16_FICCA|nr:hypothetical protein TIFTF001_033936 [Ficus carica]